MTHTFDYVDFSVKFSVVDKEREKWNRCLIECVPQTVFFFFEIIIQNVVWF